MSIKNNVAESDAKVIIEVRVPAQVDDAAGKTEASTVLEKADTHFYQDKRSLLPMYLQK